MEDLYQSPFISSPLIVINPIISLFSQPDFEAWRLIIILRACIGPAKWGTTQNPALSRICKKTERILLIMWWMGGRKQQLSNALPHLRRTRWTSPYACTQPQPCTPNSAHQLYSTINHWFNSHCIVVACHRPEHRKAKAIIIIKSKFPNKSYVY